jgi:hypothetical protein
MNVDNEYSLRKTESVTQELKINFITKLRKYFPKGKFHSILLIFFKFLGVLIITHSGIVQNPNTTSSYVNLASYLRKILFFQPNETNFQNFSLYCLLIFFFILLTLYLLYFIYHDYKENFFAKKSGKKIYHSQKDKNSFASRFKKILFYILCFMIDFIVLFSQHLIEILANIYLDLYISEIYKNDSTNHNDKNYQTIIDFQESLEWNLIINKYFFFVFNVIFIVIINIISYFYFKYLNEPFISSKTNMKYSTNKSFILVLVLLSNMTAIHALDIVFPSSTNIKVVQLVICSILLLYHLTSYNKFLFFNLINFMCTIITIFCIISTTMEFIIYLSNNVEILSLKVNFLRFLIEGILSLILTIIFFLRKKIRNLRKIPQIIFSRNKFMSIHSLREILQMLKEGIYHCKNLNEIFLIFNEHRNSCNDKSCPCEKYEIENFLTRFLERKNVVVTHDDHFIKSFEESFGEIIILIETEILKSISNISNKKIETDEKLENFLLLHIEYVLYFKRKTQFGIYLKNRYAKLKPKDFMFQFYLKILEKKSIKIEKNSNISRAENYYRENKFPEIFNYINLLNSLQSLMVKNLENYEKLLKLKNLYNSRLLKGGLAINKENKQKISTEILLDSCIKLNSDYKELINLINREFIESNLQNAELCFLLHNFYYLIDKSIPVEIESSFISIQDYNILQNFQTSFEEKGIRHPMILNLNIKNFIISYISQKLCDTLGYKRHELINEDFHKLLPDIITEEHTLIIRKFLLIEKNNFFKKETFVIGKNGRFFPINITFSVLPGLSENTYIIDVKTNCGENSLDRENSFVMVLDRSFSLITFNQEFEERFHLCLEMMKKTEASVMSLFAISENQILNEFRENLKDVNNLKSNIDHFDNLVEIMRCPELRIMLREESKRKIERGVYTNNNSSAYNDFSRNFEKNFEIKFGANFLKSKIIYRRKKVLVPYLQKLQSMIIENEFPREWLVRVSELEKSLMQSYTPMNYSRNKSGINTNTSNNNNTFRNDPNDLLKIEVQLRNLVNLPYYLIRMWESKSEKIIIKAQTSFKNLMSSSIVKSTEDKDEIGVNYIKNKKGVKFTYNKDFTLRRDKVEELDEKIEDNEDMYEDNEENNEEEDNDIPQFKSVEKEKEDNNVDLYEKEDLDETKVLSNTEREEAMKIEKEKEKEKNKRKENEKEKKKRKTKENENNKDKKIKKENKEDYEEENLNTPPRYKSSKISIDKGMSNLNISLIVAEKDKQKDNEVNVKDSKQDKKEKNVKDSKEDKKEKNVKDSKQDKQEKNENIEKQDKQEKNENIEKQDKKEKNENIEKQDKKEKNENIEENEKNSKKKEKLFSFGSKLSNNKISSSKPSNISTNKNNSLIAPEPANKQPQNPNESINNTINNSQANLINASLNNSLGLGLNINKNRHRSIYPKNHLLTTNASVNEFTDTSSIYNFKDNKSSSTRKFRNKIILHKKNSKKFKKSTINFITLFITLSILSFISIYNVFFSLGKLDSSQHLFKINFSAMGLRSSIIYLASGITSACLKSGGLDFSSVDGFISSMEDFQTKFKRRSKEMYFYVYKLKNLLAISGDVEGIEKVDDAMHKYDTYSLLAENWDIFSRKTIFSDELDYFHYYTANLQNSGLWGKCLITSQGVVSSEKGVSAKFGEKTTFYTINNVMKKFRVNLGELTTASSKLLQDFHTDSKSDLVIFNIVIVCVFMILGVTIVISIVQYKNKINFVLKKLFAIKKEDDIFEKRLLNFKTVLLCLDQSVAERYEETKLRISREMMEFNEKLIEMKNKKNNNLENNNNNIKTQSPYTNYTQSQNESNHYISTNQSQSNNYQSIHTSNKSGIVPTITSSSTHNMSSSLHQTNSHLLLSIDNSRDDNHTLKILNPVLGKKKHTILKKVNKTMGTHKNSGVSSTNLVTTDPNNKNNINCTNNTTGSILVPFKTPKDINLERSIIEYINLKDKENNLLSENYKENFEDYFYISFVKSSFVIIIIFNLFYVILVLVNIVTNMTDFDRILFSNRIAMNFMDRIPRFMDLILYYQISILLNDANFITKSQSSYSEYSDFYNVLNTHIDLSV